MQIELVRTYVSWNDIIKRADIPKYPKKEIIPGLTFYKGEPNFRIKFSFGN